MNPAIAEIERLRDQAMPKRKGDFIQVYHGTHVWPMDPRPEEIHIEDIAHHLSFICRYTGALTKFYSVAQHSVYVSLMVQDEFALQGLMHDASEAYLCDLASPLAASFPELKAAHNRMMECIATKFGFDWPEAKEVKQADLKMGATEAHQLLKGGPKGWAWNWRPYVQDYALEPVSSGQAEMLFMQRFNELTKNGLRNFHSK